jgi:hypothetical protein
VQARPVLDDLRTGPWSICFSQWISPEVGSDYGLGRVMDGTTIDYDLAGSMANKVQWE